MEILDSKKQRSTEKNNPESFKMKLATRSTKKHLRRDIM